MSIVKLMKSAFFLWKKYFIKIALSGFIVYLPTQISIELVSLLLKNLNDVKLINNIYNIIKDVFGSVALLGIINFSVKILNNEKEQTVSEIISHGLKKWGEFIGTGFIAGCKILLYFILLVIPGIYKSVRLSFIDCVVSTSDSSFTDACNESEKLTEGKWWRVFGFLILMFLLEFLFEVIVILPIYQYMESNIVSIVLGVIIKIFETYFIVVKANYYFNLVKIKERNITLSEKENIQTVIKNELEDSNILNEASEKQTGESIMD